MIKYAIPKKVTNTLVKKEYENRGMLLEEAINITNRYYLDNDKAVIYKKPTPIHVVKIDNSSNGAKISEAFFEKPSTTDYNGIYRGKYIDFEAKETKNKTIFSLSNIYEHQVKHLDLIKKHGGIAFIIVRFSLLDEVYLLDADIVSSYYYSNESKSIPHRIFQEKGHLIHCGYLAQVDYLKVVDEVYFK
jgi:recombination protein U